MEITEQRYFCVTSSQSWQFAGYVLFALKVAIPLIIIILGIMDFTRATTASKDEEIADSTKGLIFRLIIGAVVFFVPTVISLIFNLINNATSAVEAADACQRCLLRPFTSECGSYVAEAKEIRENQANKLEGDDSDYIIKKEACYFCTSSKKYVWDLIPSCQNYQRMSKYTTEADCLNPANPTDIPNLVEHQDGNTPGKALTPEQLEEEFAKLKTTPTYSELVKMAKDMYGMSESEFKVALGWAKGEGYERLPNLSGKIDYYLGYLCDCIGLNFYKGYGTKSAQELADKIRGGGPYSLYSLSAFYNKAQQVIDSPSTYANTLKMMYLVLKYPDENAHACYGPTASEQAFYKRQGGNLYYQGGAYESAPTLPIQVWSQYYEGFKHWTTTEKNK